MKAAAIVSVLVSLLATNSLAASITCKTVAKIPATVLQYAVKDTPSQRLNSPLLYSNTSGNNIILQEAVAQYKTSGLELYILADDENEVPTLRLAALGAKNKYVGVISEFNAAGAVSKNIAVTCVLAQ